MFTSTTRIVAESLIIHKQLLCLFSSRAQLVEKMWTLFNTIRDHKDSTGRQLSLIFVKLPSKLVSAVVPSFLIIVIIVCNFNIVMLRSI